MDAATCELQPSYIQAAGVIIACSNSLTDVEPSEVALTYAAK